MKRPKVTLSLIMSPTVKSHLRKKKNRDGAAAALPQRLELLRQQRSWTQSELARRLGVQRSIVANYEHGYCLPPLPMLERLAKTFEISLDYLVFGESKAVDAIKDRDLLKLFVQADELDYTAKAALKQIIEGLIAREVLKKAS
jgi:transcriptional regulator with XRE-family HTH domain